MNKENQPSTKKDLKKLESKLKFSWKKDLGNLESKLKLWTRKELKGLRIDLVEKMLEMEFKFEKRFGQMDQKIDDKFSQVLDGQDKIMGELSGMREERTLLRGRVYDNTERIEVLEQKVGVEPE